MSAGQGHERDRRSTDGTSRSPARTESPELSGVLALQRLIGNAATAQLLTDDEAGADQAAPGVFPGSARFDHSVQVEGSTTVAGSLVADAVGLGWGRTTVEDAVRIARSLHVRDGQLLAARVTVDDAHTGSLRADQITVTGRLVADRVLGAHIVTEGGDDAAADNGTGPTTAAPDGGDAAAPAGERLASLMVGADATVSGALTTESLKAGNVATATMTTASLVTQQIEAGSLSTLGAVMVSGPLVVHGDLVVEGTVTASEIAAGQIIERGRADPGAERPLHRGQKGDAVRQAQQWLAAFSLPVVPDGMFGPRTEAAVRSFQRDHQLEVNGQVDDPTWDLLSHGPSASEVVPGSDHPGPTVEVV